MMRNLLALLFLLAAAPLASAAGVKEAKSLRSSQRSLQDDVDESTGVEDTETEGGVNVEDILGFGCFSEDATVQVQHQEAPVPMKDLQIGDKVLTAQNEYAPIYTFGHRSADKTDVFIQLETRLGNLQMTPEHLVFLNGKSVPVRADSIEPGHVLKAAGAGAKVFATSLIVRKGVYAPFTTEGTILVDGIAASSYIALQPTELVDFGGYAFLSQHQFVHLTMAPLRMACLGISSTFCDDNESGMPTYIAFAVKLQQFADRQSSWVQALLMVGWVMLMSVCWMVEYLFGAANAPTYLLFVAWMVGLARAMNIRVRCKVVFPQETTTN